MIRSNKTIKGITLIALMITVIILLILAGVTIATLTGENGILNLAQGSKIKSKMSEIEEKVKLAVMSSRLSINNNATIDTTILQEELENSLGEDLVIEKMGENTTLPWNITKNKYKFQITTQGDVIQITGLTLSQTVLKMMVGQEPVTLIATLTEGIEGQITWTSSDTSVATVNNGTVTLVGESGTAIITASVKSEGVTYESKCTVVILQKVTLITVEDMEIGKGSSAQLKVTTTPEKNVEELTYTSSDETIATVDNTGKVTIEEDAISGSTVIITVAGKVSTDVTGTCTITVAKQIVEVTAEQIANNPKLYYGKQVVNYKANDSDTNIYRIFYIDTDNYFGDGVNTVYLKADFKHTARINSNYDVDKTKIKQMNPLWAVEKTDEEYTINEIGSAYLCDPTKWTGYYNEDYANYAIGGPSVEMFVKSYNQAHKDDGKNHIFSVIYNKSKNGYQYILDGGEPVVLTDKYTLLCNNEHNYMYVKGSDERSIAYVLCSPIATSNYLCCVGYYSGGLSYCPGANSTGLGSIQYVCPLISLKPSFEIKIEQ